LQLMQRRQIGSDAGLSDLPHGGHVVLPNGG
jgi:hypothetical protein